MSDLRKASKYAVQRKRHSIWRNVVTGIAAVVVFCTTYALILPAITMESEPTYCGFEDHEHTEECYELVCGVDEFVPHHHTDECYTNAEGNIDRDNGPFCHKEETTVHVHSDGCKVVLTCELEEYDPHPQHTDECYGLHPVLICEEQEIAAHAHDENCYVQGYTCGLAESEGHTHGGECYDESGELVCTVEESDGHTHSDACLGQVLSCGLEETDGHTHDDTCYEEQNGLICTSPVGEGHTHDSDCYETHDTFQCGHPEGKVVHQHNTNCYRLICEEHVHTEECYVKPEEAPAPKAQLRAAPANEPTVRDLLLEVFTEEELQEICDTYPEYTLEDIWALLNTPMTLDNDLDLVNVKNNGTGTVNIKTSKDINGQWQESNEFDSGNGIRLDLSFTIGAGVLQQGQDIVYNLPTGVQITNPVTNEDVLSADGQSVIGKFSVSATGEIRIHLNEGAVGASAIAGKLFFEGTASQSESDGNGQVAFPGTGTSITVKPGGQGQNNKDHHIQKTGSLNDDGTISYTVQITTNNGSNPLEVNDYLTNADFINQVDIKKYTNDNPETINVTPQIGPNPENSAQQMMKINLDPLANSSEYYEITYKVQPKNNPSADGKITVNNYVAAEYQNSNIEIIAQKSKISKSGSYDADKNVINWTIKVNEDGKNIAGWTLKDLLPDGLKIVGDVNLTGKDGSQANINSSVKNNNELNYTFPENATPQEYTVTFQSTAPADNGNVDNTGTFEKGDETYTSGTTVGVKHRTRDLSKTYREVQNNDGQSATLKWQTEMKLEEGYFNQFTDLVYEDFILTPESPAGAQHYGTAQSIIAGISQSIQVDLGKNWQSIGDYATYAVECYTEKGGTQVYPDDDTPVKYFKVIITPKATVSDDTIVTAIHFDYQTTAVFTGLQQGAKVTFKNSGKFGDIEKDDKWEYDKPLTIQKGIVQNVNNADAFVPENTKVEYSGNGQVIRYRLVLRTQKGQNDPIELTDLLPAGVTFDGLKAFWFTFSNDWDTQGNKTSWTTADGTEYNFGIGSGTSADPQPEEDGSTKVKIRIPGGYNTSGYDGGVSIFIDYDVIVTDAVWPDSVTEKVYLNNSIAGFGGDDHTVELHRTPERVKKSVEQQEYTDTHGNKKWRSELDYTVVINPAGENLDPNSEYITLVDNMSGKNFISAALLMDTVQLYNYSSTAEDHKGSLISSSLYTISTVETDPLHPQFSLTLPDEMPAVLTYTYSFNTGTYKAPEVSNEVELMGYSDGLENTKIQVNSAGAILDSSYIEMHKVDSVYDNKLLDGAEFSLSYWDSETSAWVPYKGNSSLRLTTGTKKSGAIRFETVAMEEVDSSFADAFIYRNVLYKLTETKAPVGYGLPAEGKRDTYFAWVSTDDTSYSKPSDIADNSVNVISTGDVPIIKVPNTSTSIQVHKVWLDSTGQEVSPPANTEIEVQLSRQTKEAVYYTVTVLKENVGVTHYYDVPKAGQIKITLGTYNPATIKVDGETVLEKPNGDEYKVVYQLNDVQANHDIFIQCNADLEPVKISSPTIFNYGDAEIIDETLTLNAANNWSNMWENLDVADSDGKPYYYTVTELNAPEGWAVSYGATNGRIQTGDITVVNTRPTETQTQIVVKKVWLDPEGNESSPAVDEIEFILWQQASDKDAPTKYGTYKINSGLYWQKPIYRLPYKDFSDTGELIRTYTYSVQETTTGKFVTEYDGQGIASGNIAIKNIKPEGDFIKISVDKQWFRGEEPTDAPIDEVRFHIMQKAGEDGTPTEVYVGTLNSTNEWKDSKSGLPMFTDNTFTTAYSYDVEELTTSESSGVAFESEVIKDGYNFTIKNTLPDIETVDVKVQKIWEFYDYDAASDVVKLLTSSMNDISFEVIRSVKGNNEVAPVTLEEKIVVNAASDWYGEMLGLPKFGTIGEGDNLTEVEYDYTVNEILGEQTLTSRLKSEIQKNEETQIFEATNIVDATTNLKVVKKWVNTSGTELVNPSYSDIDVYLIQTEEPVILNPGQTTTECTHTSTTTINNGDGTHTITCIDCSEIIAQNAPCDTNGANNTCSVCGGTHQHTPGTTAQPNNDGTHSFRCTLCNGVVSTVNCNTSGNNGSCSVCGYTPTPTHQHTPGNAEFNGDGTHSVRCTDPNCSNPLISTENCDNTNGSCSVCGHNHSFDEIQKNTNPVNTHRKHCSVCGKWYDEACTLVDGKCTVCEHTETNPGTNPETPEKTIKVTVKIDKEWGNVETILPYDVDLPVGKTLSVSSIGTNTLMTVSGYDQWHGNSEYVQNVTSHEWSLPDVESYTIEVHIWRVDYNSDVDYSYTCNFEKPSNGSSGRMMAPRMAKAAPAGEHISLGQSNSWQWTDERPLYGVNGKGDIVRYIYTFVEYPDNAKTSALDENGVWVIENEVDTSVTLPETGGIGLSLFMMAGGGLTGGAAAGLAVQKYKPKRKRGRFERRI